ncbi:MAG: glycoside hydrolase family 2, partial [Nostoc sp.]
MKLLDIKNHEVNLASKTDSNFVDLTAAHPRPLLKRSRWQTLNGQWKFAFDDQGKCVEPSDFNEWSHHIEVPYAPESTKSGISDRGFHPNC